MPYEPGASPGWPAPGRPCGPLAGCVSCLWATGSAPGSSLWTTGSARGSSANRSARAAGPPSTPGRPADRATDRSEDRLADGPADRISGEPAEGLADGLPDRPDEDEPDEHEVALKVMPTAGRAPRQARTVAETARRELELGRGAGHPRLVRLLDSLVLSAPDRPSLDGAIVLVMERAAAAAAALWAYAGDDGSVQEPARIRVFNAERGCQGRADRRPLCTLGLAIDPLRRPYTAGNVVDTQVWHGDVLDAECRLPQGQPIIDEEDLRSTVWLRVRLPRDGAATTRPGTAWLRTKDRPSLPHCAAPTR